MTVIPLGLGADSWLDISSCRLVELTRMICVHAIMRRGMVH